MNHVTTTILPYIACSILGPVTASTSRLGGWSQAYETERKPPENPPIHSGYFPTVYLHSAVHLAVSSSLRDPTTDLSLQP